MSHHSTLIQLKRRWLDNFWWKLPA